MGLELIYLERVPPEKEVRASLFYRFEGAQEWIARWRRPAAKE